MIELRELVKRFDGVTVLDGLNITVPKGAVYGLVGPNGAGKTTAIRHLAGILRQDAGQVLVDGQPVYENAELKGRTAYIPDEIYYYNQACIADIYDLYKGVYRRFSPTRFHELAEVFPLDMKRPIRKMSRGMQKQAAFWIALSCQPDFVLMDEPVDGLDPVMRRQVWSLLLSDVAQREMTVLVSSHNLRELEDVCDRVGIMDKGKMSVERSLSELQDNLVKIQLALSDGVSLPEGLNILHSTTTGRLRQLILRGKAEELTQALACASPLFIDVLPLTLEEIFIYELGGADNESENTAF